MDSQSTEERAEKVIIALTPEQLKDICANAAEIGAKKCQNVRTDPSDCC